jgi:hypothetical protein
MTTWWVRYCTYRFLETHLIRNTIILPMQYIISCVYVITDQHIMVQYLFSISRVRYLSLLIYSGHFHRDKTRAAVVGIPRLESRETQRRIITITYGQEIEWR